MANSLTFYKDSIPELANCSSTIKFCLFINNLFDALNRKSPKGIQENSTGELENTSNEAQPRQVSKKRPTHGVVPGDEDFQVSRNV